MCVTNRAAELLLSFDIGSPSNRYASGSKTRNAIPPWWMLGLVQPKRLIVLCDT